MPVATPPATPPATPENGRVETPVCEQCKKETVPVLSVPLPYAPGFEDIYYQCPVCKVEVKRTALPL